MQFRYDYLKETILEPMKKKEKGFSKVKIYNKENDDYNIGIINLSPDVVIIEGVFLQRPELKDYFDFMIYIDIDRETQLQRALLRGNNGKDEKEIRKKYAEKYNPAEDKYLLSCNPRGSANIVIEAHALELNDEEETGNRTLRE